MAGRKTRSAAAPAVWPALAAAAWLLLAAGCAGSPGAAVKKQLPPTTAKRRAVVTHALDRLGAPYKPGAAGDDAFDSSGLTTFAYRRAGAQLPRGVQAQVEVGQPIAMDQAQPADLVFIRVKNAGAGTRLLVGIYTQPGQMILAEPGGHDQPGVRLVDLSQVYWQQRLVGITSILPKKP